MPYNTFVLGAGSSIDFGFPTGKQFVDFITLYFDSNRIIDYATEKNFPKDGSDFNVKETEEYSISLRFRRILSGLGYESDQLREFTSRLRLSNIDSIDTFLARKRNEGLIDMGKAIITLSILHFECISNLSGDSWLRYLWNRFIDSFLNINTTPNFKIVTFNYDRSFEHFLYTSIKHTTDWSDEEIKKRIEALEITHVHGKVGYLPWENESYQVDFGEELDPSQIRKVINDLKIVHEKPEEIAKIRTMVSESRRTYFLGFGYHSDNLKKLFSPSSTPKTNIRSCIGTCVGVGTARRSDTNYEIKKLTNDYFSVAFEEGSISEVLDENLRKNK